MKKSFVLFAYTALCVVGLQLSAADLLVPKGKTQSGSKVAFDEKKIPGVTGAQGLTGATGPVFMPVYATAYQSELKVFDSGETEIVVPFSTLQKAKGISLSNDAFTLPKGTYSVHFQFTASTEDVFAFNGMRLELGSGSAIPLDWSAAYNYELPITSAEATSIVGSKIFSIENDNTEVTLVITRTATTDFAFYDASTTNNHPTRIVFHKLKG